MYELYCKVLLKDGRKGYIVEKYNFTSIQYLVELPGFEFIEVDDSMIEKQIDPN